MSQSQTLLLGAIAGVTIFIALPLGRVERLSTKWHALFTGSATGILIFLLWDVLTNAIEGPISDPLEVHDWGTFAPRAALLVGGFTLGLMSLVYYDSWMKGRAKRAIDADEVAAGRLGAAERLALLIAVGIGIHNFGEGLAIGQSSAGGDVSLALALIIGFALHNSTEGFAIIGPMAGSDKRPTWAFLIVAGVIGGGPTFLGTAIGYQWVSIPLQVFFFSLAAGSILFVVFELAAVCRKYQMPVLVYWAIMLGLVLGFGTDFVLDAVGA